MTRDQTASQAPAVKIVRIKISDLPRVQGLTPSEIEVLLGTVPLLKKPKHLNVTAVNLAVLQHPPLLRRKRRKGGGYEVIGNIRTIEICKQTLLPTTRVTCLVVDGGTAETTATCLKLNCFISALWFGMDSSASNNSIFELIDSIPPHLIEMISPDLGTKSGRERLLGLNRRYRRPERKSVVSPTAKRELAGHEEDTDEDS